jgi:hypothetical protein
MNKKGLKKQRIREAAEAGAEKGEKRRGWC